MAVKHRKNAVFCEANDCMTFGRILIEMAEGGFLLICDYHAALLKAWGEENNMVMPITFYEKLDPRRIEEYLGDKSQTRRKHFGM